VIYLLDTDTCIHLLRGTKSAVTRAEQHGPSDLAVSAITRYELLYGVEKCPPNWRKKEAGKVELLLEHIHILPFTAETATRAATIRAVLETAGRSIGPMDVLIAATALDHDLPIVTSNLAEFLPVPGLRCESWTNG
jgi:tRNA(fMet)-specific endonuclease VapC